MRSRPFLTVVSLLALTVCLLALGPAVDFEHARAGDKPRELRASKATYGSGMVKYGGIGPERWRWRYVLEKRKTRQLSRSLYGAKVALKRRWQPTVDYAYRLAAVTYSVSESDLRSIGGCESHHYPFARNGIYRGVMQEGPMFERGPYGQAGFSVWDPLANVLTAAHARVADGSWRQWECKP